MTTFDLHIIRRTLGSFILLVLVLIIFFVVLHYVEYIDDFMDRGAEMSEVAGTYYPSMIPEIIRLTSPLALFLACVYTTGKLAQELQIMALKVAGVSLFRLMLPNVVVAVAVTGFMFWFNGWVVPGSNQTVLEFERRYLKDAGTEVQVSDLHRQNRPGQILTVGYFDQDSETGHRVSLQRFRDPRTLESRIDADRIEWVDSTGAWRMFEAVERTFAAGGPQDVRSLGTVDTTLNIYPRDLARDDRDVETMSLPAAAEYVATLERSGVGNLGRTLVSYFSKFTYPLANLILALIAVPLASERRRGGQAIRIGTGLLVAFVYLAVMKLTEPFGYSGDVSPLIAATLPHGIFFLVAVVALFRANR